MAEGAAAEQAAAAEAAKVEVAEKLLSAAAAKQQTKADARLKAKIDELQVGAGALAPVLHVKAPNPMLESP